MIERNWNVIHSSHDLYRFDTPLASAFIKGDQNTKCSPIACNDYIIARLLLRDLPDTTAFFRKPRHYKVIEQLRDWVA